MTMQAELPYRPAFNDAARWFTGVREPVLAGTAFLMLALMAPTTFAYLVDARTVGDISVWTKPLKFQISLAVYLATLAFFARYVPRETLLKPWYRVYALAVAGAVILEMIWLMSAATMGTSSHFNPTPLGQTIYRTMGALAVLLTSMSAVQAWQIARNGLTGLSPTMKHGLVAGLALVLPLTLLTAGAMSTMGSHAVGIDPAGAERLALLGWLREGGDLRVAHFFATHAMHFVPAAALVIAFSRARSGVVLVYLAAGIYAAFTVFTFLQALAGEPFLAAIGQGALR